MIITFWDSEAQGDHLLTHHSYDDLMTELPCVHASDLALPIPASKYHTLSVDGHDCSAVLHAEE